MPGKLLSFLLPPSSLPLTLAVANWPDSHLSFKLYIMIKSCQASLWPTAVSYFASQGSACVCICVYVSLPAILCVTCRAFESINEQRKGGKEKARRRSNLTCACAKHKWTVFRPLPFFFGWMDGQRDG